MRGGTGGEGVGEMEEAAADGGRRVGGSMGVGIAKGGGKPAEAAAC